MGSLAPIHMGIGREALRAVVVELAELVMEDKTTWYVSLSPAFLSSIVRAAVGSIHEYNSVKECAGVS